MQQFGGTKSRWPHLWGSIPARPFLGVNPDDEREILDILRKHMLKTWR
jgi:phage gpG-like protein